MTVQPSISTILYKTLNILITSCYLSMCFSPNIFADASPLSLA
jgi:hypothetical protein